MASNVEKLTRAELEADHVTSGIARWGEAERAGLASQARAKSLETLRVEYSLRHGDEDEALAASERRQRHLTKQYQAPSCLEDGLT
jgi:hypothetical protein